MLNWEDKFNEWCLKYEPMDNNIDMNAVSDKFETFGKDLEYVLSIANTEPARVWTLVDGDDGNLYISSGYHLVNRINYFITHKPCESEYEEYPYFIYDEEDHAL